MSIIHFIPHDTIDGIFQIHPILDILACIGCRKTTSGVLESSHQALSIGGGFKAKYRPFANRLN